ncbi:MAG: BREX system ATP-binding domain-containing protein [Polyangiaceae bacterium]
MPGERPVRGGTADPPPGWPLGLLAATGQTLEDLAYCGSAEVVFVRYPRGASAAELLDGVVARALTAGFVVARLPVGTGAAFDELESLLREALRVIGAAETSRARRGLAALFDVFASRHGRAAPQEMDERLGAAHLDGELATLARLWIEGRGGRAEHARLEGWIAGTELGRAAAPEARDGALPALSARTAKRVLVEVTRVVRALGWRGTLLVVEGAEAMASLPPARRQAAYTVLRELLDNADGGRGMTAALVVVAGSTSLFTGPRSIGSLPPLAARVLPDETRGDAAGGADHRPRTAPHQPLLDVISVDLAVRGLTAPEPHVPSGEAGALGDVVRAMRGLPPLHGARAASVGQARIDAAVEALFQHSRVDGSVFALLTGAYGTGKSHVLAHVAERALAESRPVLRLSLERLDADLGHPERHLRRLLEQSTVPLRRGGGAPSRSPLELCAEWTLSPTRRASWSARCACWPSTTATQPRRRSARWPCSSARERSRRRCCRPTSARRTWAARPRDRRRGATPTGGSCSGWP